MSNRAFYDLTSNHSIDNPDQRIADDVNSFSQKSLMFLLEMVSAVLQLIAFSGILWSISKTLIWVLVGYALIGTTVTFFVFGKPMIGLNFQQLRKEADFRFSLIRIRENAEGIAFYRGEKREGAHVRERFAALYENYKLLKRTLGLNFFQYLFSFLTYACYRARDHRAADHLGRAEEGRPCGAGGWGVRRHAERAHRVRRQFRELERVRGRHGASSLVQEGARAAGEQGADPIQRSLGSSGK